MAASNRMLALLGLLRSRVTRTATAWVRCSEGSQVGIGALEHRVPIRRGDHLAGWAGCSAACLEEG